MKINRNLRSSLAIGPGYASLAALGFTSAAPRYSIYCINLKDRGVYIELSAFSDFRAEVAPDLPPEVSPLKFQHSNILFQAAIKLFPDVFFPRN